MRAPTKEERIESYAQRGQRCLATSLAELEDKSDKEHELMGELRAAAGEVLKDLKAGALRHGVHDRLWRAWSLAGGPEAEIRAKAAAELELRK